VKTLEELKAENLPLSSSGRMKNPYLDSFNRVRKDPVWFESAFKARQGLVRKYSWAIPNDEAIAKIARYSGVLEIGAGTGYWSWLLRQVGASVIATEPTPGGGDRYQFTYSWTEKVELSALEAVKQYGEGRALMSVWPCYDKPWCAEALKAYKGSTFIYVGEGMRGCTGDETLHEMLWREDAPWDLAESVAIPRWQGLHDQMHVFLRR